MAPLAETLKSAAFRLAQALGLEPREARLEAQILAARALDVNRAWLIAHDREPLAEGQSAAMEALVARRERGEPVAYILGEKEFYGRMFKVTPDVLIPRPETELLVEAALARLPKDRPARILDLGTGSGCIAITLALERPDCEVVAVDASPAALEIARCNAVRHGALGVRFLRSDWYEALEGQKFDMIVSNPPYVAESDAHLTRGDLRSEPLAALASGEDGLRDIRSIITDGPQHLDGPGWLLLEHGYDQAAACARLFRSAGLEHVTCLPDWAGLDRVSLGRRTGREAS